MLGHVLSASTLLMPSQRFGQSASTHHHDKLIDIGTFGDPAGGITKPSWAVHNNRGMLVGVSDIAAPDLYAPHCFGFCNGEMGFLAQQDAVMTPLPSHRSGAEVRNFAAAVDDVGWIVGASENGAVDPLTGWPETSAVTWKQGRVSVLIGDVVKPAYQSHFYKYWGDHDNV